MINNQTLRTYVKRHASPALRSRIAKALSWGHRIRSFLLVPYVRRRNSGLGSKIDRSAQILGWQSIRLGRAVVISENCWLNVNAPGRSERSISIGDYSLIGRRNSISSGKSITMGAYTLTGPDCHFIGSGHIYDTPFRPYVSTGNTHSDVITIGANCWFGVGAKVIGSVTVGHGCIVGADCLIRTDIPPFSIVVGNPARIVKRYNCIAGEWVSCRDFTAEMEAAIPEETTYLARLRSDTPTLRMPYLASGYRSGSTL